MLQIIDEAESRRKALLVASTYFLHLLRIDFWISWDIAVNYIGHTCVSEDGITNGEMYPAFYFALVLVVFLI